MWFGEELTFWIAVIGATVLKVLTSPYFSIMRALGTVATAVFCAYFFTDPAIDLLGLNPETYKIPMAALLALIGESLIRAVLGWLENNQELIERIIKAWRGNK